MRKSLNQEIKYLRDLANLDFCRFEHNITWVKSWLNQVHSPGKVGQYASNSQVGKITGKYIFEKYITSRYLRILYNVQVNAYLRDY